MLNPKYVIFPNGGKGNRFRDVEINKLKPFINVYGRNQIEWSLTSTKINFPQTNKFVFGSRTELISEFKSLLLNIEKDQGIKYELIDVGLETSGPASTVAIILNELIKDDADFGFLIADNDLFTLIDTEKIYADSDCVIFYTKSANASHSFIEINTSMQVTKIAEKQMISQYGVVGNYYFKSAASFVKYFEKIKNARSELYISKIVDEYIKSNKYVLAKEVSFVSSFGTPEEIKALTKHQSEVLGKYVV